MSAGVSVRTQRHALAWLPVWGWRHVRAALLGLGLVAPLAAEDGGFAPTAWGWTSFALAGVAAVAAVARPQIRYTRLELAAVVGLGAFAGWTGLSAFWADSAGDAVLAFQRTLVYATALLAAGLVVRSAAYRSLVGGTWAAIALVCVYAVLTRLLPDRLGLTYGLAGNRLSAPIGYWNALGLFAAVGLLLALGLAALGRSVLLRALAAASLVPIVLTLYFTFSRGAWIALGLAVVAQAALDPRRLRLALTLLVAGPCAAAAVWLASGSDGLTRLDASPAAAIADGRHILELATLLAAGAAAAVAALAVAERRVAVPRRVERGFAVVLCLALAAALAAVFARFGGPVTLVERGWHGFNAPPVRAQPNLNARLFSVSGGWRVQLWDVAWDAFRSRPVVGAGAGAYEAAWLEHRPIPSQAVNAHSLYLETMAELGVPGLVLLLVGLGAPLAAAVRARGRTLVPTAGAAYVAFLVHAGVDWDWQLPAVAVAALLCGAGVLAAARPDERSARALDPRGSLALVLVAVAVAVASVAGLVGNRAAAASAAAVDRGDWAAARAEARTARRWMPWSAEPWRLLGEVDLRRGRLGAAHRSFLAAIERDRRNWELWLDVAFATDGWERDVAARRAYALNPLSPEIAEIAPALGLDRRQEP